MRGRLTHPPGGRLRAKSDFDSAYGRGKRTGNALFGAVICRNERGRPRLGLAVAVRVAGSSVERNRIRRIIRESFRLHQHELPPVDIVVSAKNQTRDAPGPVLHTSLAALWKRVIEQCATLPRSSSGSTSGP